MTRRDTAGSSPGTGVTNAQRKQLYYLRSAFVARREAVSLRSHDVGRQVHLRVAQAVGGHGRNVGDREKTKVSGYVSSQVATLQVLQRAPSVNAGRRDATLR